MNLLLMPVWITCVSRRLTRKMQISCDRHFLSLQLVLRRFIDHCLLTVHPGHALLLSVFIAIAKGMYLTTALFDLHVGEVITTRKMAVIIIIVIITAIIILLQTPTALLVPPNDSYFIRLSCFRPLTTLGVWVCTRSHLVSFPGFVSKFLTVRFVLC
jgi:hypothetical protein